MSDFDNTQPYSVSEQRLALGAWLNDTEAQHNANVIEWAEKAEATLDRVREAIEDHQATSELDCMCGWRGGHGDGSSGQHVTRELRAAYVGE
jgi:hypothetical protein